jgi:hypothetical protein
VSRASNCAPVRPRPHDFFAQGLKSPRSSCIIAGVRRGGLAQLGERFNGIEEVSGSIPLSSTTGLRVYGYLLSIITSTILRPVALSDRQEREIDNNSATIRKVRILDSCL